MGFFIHTKEETFSKHSYSIIYIWAPWLRSSSTFTTCQIQKHIYQSVWRLSFVVYSKSQKKNLLTFNTYLLFSYHFRNYKHELSWLEIFWLEMSWMNVLLRVHRFHRLRNLLCTSNFSPKNGSQTDYFTYYSQLHNSSGSEVY